MTSPQPNDGSFRVPKRPLTPPERRIFRELADRWAYLDQQGRELAAQHRVLGQYLDKFLKAGEPQEFGKS